MSHRKHRTRLAFVGSRDLEGMFDTLLGCTSAASASASTLASTSSTAEVSDFGDWPGSPLTTNHTKQIVTQSLVFSPTASERGTLGEKSFGLASFYPSARDNNLTSTLTPHTRSRRSSTASTSSATSSYTSEGSCLLGVDIVLPRFTSGHRSISAKFFGGVDEYDSDGSCSTWEDDSLSGYCTDDETESIPPAELELDSATECLGEDMSECFEHEFAALLN